MKRLATKTASPDSLTISKLPFPNAFHIFPKNLRVAIEPIIPIIMDKEKLCTSDQVHSCNTRAKL